MGQSVSDFIEIHKHLRKCRIHYSYMCRATKRYCVGNIPRYLNFVRKFPTRAGKIPTNLENIATHFIFVRNFPTQCRKIPTNSETDQNVTTHFTYVVQEKFLQIWKLTKNLTTLFDFVGN